MDDVIDMMQELGEMKDDLCYEETDKESLDKLAMNLGVSDAKVRQIEKIIKNHYESKFRKHFRRKDAQWRNYYDTKLERMENDLLQQHKSNLNQKEKEISENCEMKLEKELLNLENNLKLKHENDLKNEINVRISMERKFAGKLDEIRHTVENKTMKVYEGKVLELENKLKNICEERHKTVTPIQSFKKQRHTIKGRIIRAKIKIGVTRGQMFKMSIEDESDKMGILAFNDNAKVLQKILNVGEDYFFSFQLYNPSTHRGKLRVLINELVYTISFEKVNTMGSCEKILKDNPETIDYDEIGNKDDDVKMDSSIMIEDTIEMNQDDEDENEYKTDI